MPLNRTTKLCQRLKTIIQWHGSNWNSRYFSDRPGLNHEISGTPLLKTWRMRLPFQQIRLLKIRKAQDPEEITAMAVYQHCSTKGSRSNRVYLWGFAQYGALGKKSYLKPTDGKRPIKAMHAPCRLAFGEIHNVHDVACGYGFTVFAVSSKTEKKVFGTGMNTDSQIGYHEVRRGHPLQFLVEPAPISIPLEDYENTKIISIACGRAHTLIATDKEGIFSLGNNAYGQCGRPVVENEKFSDNPAIHKVREIEHVKEVVCGQDNTIFMTEEGEIYSCGWGADGQTGIGHYKSEWKPTRVKGDLESEKIVQASSAGDCVLAVSDKGDVFGWGNSEYQQLSIATDEVQLCHPHYLPFKNVGKVVQAAAAGSMCGILNDKGQVFTWGYGILGFGPKVQHIRVPTLIPETLFGCNQFSPDVTVKQLLCGLNHFAAITNKGDLYMWGKNNKACLGLGHQKDQFFPLKVCLPAEVDKVFCGVDHTAALVKSFI